MIASIRVYLLVCGMEGDPRILFSIGNKHPQGAAEDCFNPTDVTFAPDGSHLFLTAAPYHYVMQRSCKDGSLLSKFGEYGEGKGQFRSPSCVVIDSEHRRILVVDACNHRVQVLALRKRPVPLLCVGSHGANTMQFNDPQAAALDRRRGRLFVSDTGNHRVQVLSSDTLSFMFSIGTSGTGAGEFTRPNGVAVDHDRDRLIVVDQYNHRVQVLSSIDGSFLFEFGSRGTQQGQFNYPKRVCIDHQGRIMVTDTNNCRLQAFSPEGQHISTFRCKGEHPSCIAFDEQRGLIAFSSDNQVHVIGANQWLPHTLYTWSIESHHDAPKRLKDVVVTVTMLRSVAVWSVLSLLPNELLFLIFEMLDPVAFVPLAAAERSSATVRERKCFIM